MTDKAITTTEDREEVFTSRDWLKTTSIHYYYESCRYHTEEMQNFGFRIPDREATIFFGKVATTCRIISDGFKELADLYMNAPDGVAEFYNDLLEVSDE